MEFKPKNRGWVKNAAIIFLAVLLVLTFFSNTFMNRSLAEVATQNVTGGSITAKVRGTGTVESNGSYQVKAESTREIRAVMVKEGQEISQGDVLFILGEGESEELEAATETLRQLQLSYQRTAINMPSFDYSLDERNIKNAKDRLTAAQAAEEQAKKELDKNVSQTVKESIQQAQAKLDFSNAALADALSKYNEALTVQEEKRVSYEQARLNYETLLNNAPPEAVSAPETTPAPETSPDPETTSVPETTSAPEATPALETSPAPEEGKSEYQAKLEAAKAEMDAAEKAWNQARADAETCSAAVDAARTQADTAQAELDALYNLSGPYADAYNQAVEARKAAEDEVFTLEYNLKQTQMQNNKTAAAGALELQDLAEQIEKAKKELAELSGGEENQVTANVGGIIETIAYTAGNTAPKGDTLCTIQVPDMGYSLSFSVTNEQARRLRTGDSASVTNYYWGSEITATLTGIKTDPKNPQTSKILTFDLTGDVNAGAELTIAVGQKSQNYDTVVPNSAIRSDTNGSYVLVVEAKNSPLGNRYIAQRVDIEVIASDDVNSAVTGDLSNGDFVITTSNKPVQKGDQVRMADN